MQALGCCLLPSDPIRSSSELRYASDHAWQSLPRPNVSVQLRFYQDGLTGSAWGDSEGMSLVSEVDMLEWELVVVSVEPEIPLDLEMFQLTHRSSSKSNNS